MMMIKITSTSQALTDFSLGIRRVRMARSSLLYSLTHHLTNAARLTARGPIRPLHQLKADPHNKQGETTTN